MTILQEVEDMLQRTGITATKLGLELFNDSSLIGKMRRGETSLGPSREARLRDWLNSQKIIAANAPPPGREPIQVSFVGQDWTRSAKISSMRLVEALRQHHPERCCI